MTALVLACYFSILIVLCIYGGHRIHITRLFLKSAGKETKPSQRFAELPVVTVQLPVFNEKYVVERLIDTTVKIDYPREKLHIQVLDDSTDETCQLAEERVNHYRDLGYQIHYIHRADRSGFKAGALANGLKTAQGDFVAVFDADFVPTPDILEKTVHYFRDPKVGMVQTRWDHLNRESNTLTKIQAIMLDAHFAIEHGGRCYSDLFFNFNGTAGLWRRQCIEDAGGWQHDTLTEDLDLSYRAQLKGWRFLFVPNITCPAELPESVLAFKSQQHRWAKGSIQVMRKLLKKIWASKVPISVKTEATFHLTGNLAYLLMVINSVFFVIPSMILRETLPWWQFLILDGTLFTLLSMSFIYFYLMSQKAVLGTIKGQKRYIPALMAIGIGLGINNTKAVLEAFLGKETPFVRTPKAGLTLASEKKTNHYLAPKSYWGILEVLLGMFYTGGIIWAIINGKWVSIPFLVIFQNGFLFMGYMTLKESLGRSKKTNSVAETDLKPA